MGTGRRTRIACWLATSILYGLHRYWVCRLTHKYEFIGEIYCSNHWLWRSRHRTRISQYIWKLNRRAARPRCMNFVRLDWLDNHVCLYHLDDQQRTRYPKEATAR